MDKYFEENKYNINFIQNVGKLFENIKLSIKFNDYNIFTHFVDELANILHQSGNIGEMNFDDLVYLKCMFPNKKRNQELD